jgi:DNA-binding NarL/FixJ family response regulator
MPPRLTKQEGNIMGDADIKELLQEMQWVRKLLMLQALAAGYKQKHLAAALGVSEATVSRMMPKGFAKEAAGGRAAAGATEH